jgi:hypothetical protein
MPPALGPAQASRTRVERLSVLGDNPVAGAVALAGHTLYAGFGRKLVISDTRAQAPAIQGSIELGDDILVLATDGRWVYALTEQGAEVVDAADPNRPQVVAGMDTGILLSGDMVLDGSRLFVANTNGIRIFDVSLPSRPRLIEDITWLGEVRRLAVADGLLAAVHYGRGVFILDAQDASNVRLTAELTLPEELEVSCELGRGAVALTGKTLLALCGGLGDLSTFLSADLSEPTAPRWIGRTAVSNANDEARVWVNGAMAYVAGGYGGLSRIDVSDPAQLPLPAWWPVDGEYVTDAAAGDDAVYVAGSGGIHTLRDSPRSAGAGPTVLGTVATSFLETPAIALDGSHAYYADPALSQIVVLDVSDPAASTKVGWVKEPLGTVKAMSVSQGLLAVAGWLSLELFDVSDPTRPAQAAMIGAGDLRDVAVAGDIVYVAAQDRGLVVIDAADPRAPRLLAELRLGPAGSGAMAVLVEGDRAYLLSAELGLAIVDVTDPSAPVLLGSLAAVGQFGEDQRAGLALVGQTLLIASAGGLSIVDATEPTHPTLLSWFAMPHSLGTVQDIVVAGEWALVTCSGSYVGGLAVLDITDPRQPVFQAAVPIYVQALVSDPRTDLLLAAIAEQHHGFGPGALQLISWTQSVRFEPLPGLQLDGGAWAVAARAGYAFLANGWQGLHVVDVRDPAKPRLAATVNLGAFAEQLAVAGDRAYLLGSAWLPGQANERTTVLYVVDVTDPPRAKLIHSLPLGNLDAPSLSLADGTAFVTVRNNEADGPGELLTIDVATPGAPRPLAKLGLPGLSMISAIATTGQTVILADARGILQLVDVADRQVPVLGRRLTVDGSIHDMTAAAGLVYLATGSSPDVTTSVQTVDMSDPARPTLRDTLDLPALAGQARLATEGGDLWVTDPAGGADVLRVGVSGSLERKGGHHPPTAPKYYQRRVRDVAVVDDMAFMAMEDALLWTLQQRVATVAECCVYLPSVMRP